MQIDGTAHQRVAAPRAGRPGPAAAPGRRWASGSMALAIPSLARSLRPRSGLRPHAGHAQPGHDPAPGGGGPQRRAHARPARVRAWPWPGGEDRWRASCCARWPRRSRSRPRIGILYIGWEWMGAGLPLRARIRPVLTAGLIVGRRHGRVVARHRPGLELGPEPGDPGDGPVVGGARPPGRASCSPTLAHLVGIGVPLHTMLSVTRALGLRRRAGRRAVAAVALGPDRGVARHGPDAAARRGPRARSSSPGTCRGGWSCSPRWRPARSGPSSSGCPSPRPSSGSPAGASCVEPLLQADPLHGGGGPARLPGHPDRAPHALQRQRLLVPWWRRRGGGSGPDRGSELGQPATPDLDYARRLRRRADGGSQHPLQDGHVDPAAELPSHLAFDADEGEPAGPVERDRGLVVARRCGR